MIADVRHRAARHHAEGIFVCEQVFGTTIRLSTCKTCGKPLDGHPMAAPETDHPALAKQIPVRWVGEQHVREDLGFIPSLQDWLKNLPLEGWMTRSRKLSRELERDELSGKRLGDVPVENVDAALAWRAQEGGRPASQP